MSTTKKLSDEVAIQIQLASQGKMAAVDLTVIDRARALEERVAELEHLDVGYRKCCAESSNDLVAATARAEDAEKRLEGQIALGQEHYRARRGAEAEVARLKAQMADQLAAFEANWVEPKALAAEVARLRRDVAEWESACTAPERLAQAERERDDLAQMYSTRTRERDEWKAKWELGYVESLAERDSARAELTDLRARIEALADEWGKFQIMNCHQACEELRALLQPPKAETALELVAALEKMANGSAPMEKLAKLRKMLENERKDPP